MTAWLSRNWLSWMLLPIASLYGLAVLTRQFLYRHGALRSICVGRPVIVIGNVITGGGGKTPLVILLVKHLQMHGFQVGVISRGYGRSSQQCLEVTPEADTKVTGDEPAMILRLTQAPVFVAPRRVDAAIALIAAYPSTDFIVSDDGLQHYSMARDMEITVFDDRGVGNGWLLPAGPLREPWPQRESPPAKLVVAPRASEISGSFVSWRDIADHAFSETGQRLALSSLTGTNHALAAIARPESFFQMLRAAGVTLQNTIALADHQDFSDFDWKPHEGATLLCTEKDAAKLFKIKRPAAVQVLAVPLHLSIEPAFFVALDAFLNSRIPKV